MIQAEEINLWDTADSPSESTVLRGMDFVSGQIAFKPFRLVYGVGIEIIGKFFL